MLSVPLFLLAGAFMCWPSACGASRLRTLGLPAGFRGPHGELGVHSGACLVAIAAVLAFVVLGPAGALVGALLGGSGWRRWRARSQARVRTAAAAGLADALRYLVAELRAGAHPAVAADSAASDAAPEAAAALRALAAGERFGGDIDSVLGRAGDDWPELRPALRQLGRGWALAQHHGLPLADVLDAVRRDLEVSQRFAAQVRAKMAGPRASAAVLACLPVLGIALGEAMGAAPVHMLSSSVAGQLLLVLGATLIWAGMAWSRRLTELGTPC